MKKIILLLMLVGLVQGAFAQPEARRQAQQKAQNKSNANDMTTRAQIMFPTAASMDEDVVWRRDIYRELDLNEDANAPLYYPVEPLGSQVNLFTYIFKLMMQGRIKAYQYKLDGNESFNADDVVKPKTFLDNYHIYYEKDAQGRTHLDNSDIPSKEVKSYYIKETTYYDQHTATFHTKVLALCPIMTRDDDFGDGGNKYPLFWVKYDDLAPFLSKQQIMTSNLNNAATMSIDDYFLRNQYKGKIYKTNNMLGKTLAQYCSSDSAMSKEQKKIEAELAAFEKNLWGDQAKKDSLDSIAKLDKKNVKGVKKNRRSSSGKSSGSTVKNRRQRSSSPSTSAARVSVRRERH
uniref:type IX secretion system ring protein PorN/GldN n=1 Tax=Prevotella sp. TaxID=59823 RepID=UPI002667058B|nr:gliding motility protein GldN [uncultured Prevotella sp.]